MSAYVIVDMNITDPEQYKPLHGRMRPGHEGLRR
jgi:uncharacterized protein (DUF1330 family)